MKNLNIILLAAFLAGCSNFTGHDLPGNTATNASGTLQRDVLLALCRQVSLDCDEKISYKNIKGTRVLYRENDRCEEEWTVEACGKTMVYTVSLNSRGSGTTYLIGKKIGG